jgi:glycosyltransferase involved in cell wall biosynthesis
VRQISTVIIAQNEEECIANSIKSCLAFADEVVVIDGGSHDATVKIAQDLGCQVYTNSWPGYAKQRNFGAQKAVNEWIFFIDADEVVGQELAAAILTWKDEPKLEANAFAVNRVGDFLGKWLHSKAEYPVRLYNKNVYQIKDVLVHEAPDVGNEQVIKLPGVLWHQGFRTINDLVSRFNKYTDLDAQKSHLAGKKFSVVRLLLKPHAKFFQVYLWQGMYKQGLVGLVVAGLWSYYIFLKEIKLYEIDLSLLKEVEAVGVGRTTPLSAVPELPQAKP